MINGYIKGGFTLLTLIRQSTGQPLFSSNSVYGILDLLLMNWANDPNFHLQYDGEASIITVNDVVYLVQYHPLADNPRGEVTISE